MEDSYALSFMQQGMLVDTLRSDHPGTDVVQIAGTLREPIHRPSFERAWRELVRRHPALRTSFRWHGLAEEPVQRVHILNDAPLRFEDWSSASPAEQGELWERFLKEDRLEGIDLTAPPAHRLSLFRLGREEHKLAWTLHHVIIDGRSLVVALRELFHLYEAFEAGIEPELPEPIPYRRYVDWLLERDPSASEAFWARYLEGLDEVSPAPREISGRGDRSDWPDHGRATHTLSTGVSDRLRELAEGHGLTLNTFLQGAWGLLLARSLGTSDVVFGSVRSCRYGTAPGIDRAVGLLINTLPVRVRIPVCSSTLRWLESIRNRHLEWRDHVHSPLRNVRRWIGDQSDVELFETVVSYEKFRLGRHLQAEGGRWARRKLQVYRRPHYPLSVRGEPIPELVLEISYRRDRFTPTTVRRMTRHLARILEGMAAHPECPVERLPMLDPAERHQVRVEWSDTTTDGRQEAVTDLFARRAREIPDAVAVTAPGEAWSYGELDRCSARLATALRRQGVGPEGLVALLADRSVWLAVGALAALRAGGAYLPMDPAYPDGRLRSMLDDAGVVAVLVEPGQDAGRLRPHRSGADAAGESPPVPTVALEAPSRALEGRPGPGPTAEGPLSPESLAYVIYTSGSTGRPKGVEVHHGGLSSLVSWHRRTYRIGPGDRSTLVASPAFDASVWELWPPLCAGATLCAPDPDTRANPMRLEAYLRRERITVGFLPTPLLEALLDGTECLEGGAGPRALLTGGDRLTSVPDAPMPFRLVNHYGPTEGTVVSTAEEVDATHRPPPIGRPIDDVRVHLRAVRGEEAAVGHPGEMLVGGRSVARGYRSRPGLTAERFVPDPDAGRRHPGARRYRTGDLAARLPDGRLCFLGRMDRQVKVRGHRIEPGEIESVLQERPEIRQAVVELVPTTSGDQRLAAFVVPAEGCDPSDSDERWRAALAERLPSFMIPDAFEVIDEVPLTPNGKVDRAALPRPEPSRSAGGTPPRSATERALGEIWSELLEVDDVHVEDDFFSLGGHSVLASRMLSAVRDELGVDLPFRSAFDHSTVEELAARVEIARERSAGTG